ncbi:hypothetical protein HA402_011003 [Bradysia odoriphaga]|nr:hypothetical protein HA402_011003 [Bradysia odoriphaga]
MKPNTNDNIAFPIPAQQRPKLSGMEFYTKTLGAPKLVVAPMVDQSELAWRLLCRRHGAQLCYTPMYHSNIFIQDIKYRQQALQSCPEDRPLIIQFCGNDPDIILEAALLAQDHCDAIDINLGCPQAIAKRGHYGAFLQDEWELLHNIVSTLHTKLLVPVTCKIRVFDDVDKTIRYAKMLESAGCAMLTVHGRTREQKGPLTGLADWNIIRIVRENISIPMFANGNILSMEDIDRCIEATNANGVMTAEGNLHNPCFFERVVPLTWDVASEYINLVEQYPCPVSYIRGHLFKLFHHLMNLKTNSEIREALAVANKPNEFRDVIKALEDKFLPFHLGDKVYSDEPCSYDTEFRSQEISFNLNLPPWLCQPYIRLEPNEHKRIQAEKFQKAIDPATVKREFFDSDGNKISRKLSKKLKRLNRRPTQRTATTKSDRNFELCSFDLINPVGLKCVFKLCKICCRDKCYTENVDCVGHKFLIQQRRAFKENNSKTELPNCT